MKDRNKKPGALAELDDRLRGGLPGRGGHGRRGLLGREVIY